MSIAHDGMSVLVLLCYALLVLTPIVCAVYLAERGIDGWLWFLVVAVCLSGCVVVRVMP